MNINHLMLASTSVYRLNLLKQVGIWGFAIRPEMDENTISAHLPLDLAKERSKAKGLNLVVPDGTLVISGDQVLEFQGKAYGKAHDASEAYERLGLFAGKSHLLHSGYALTYYESSEHEPRLLKNRVVTAKMHMRSLSNSEIKNYLDTGEWEGCAGCYQYENRGMHLFEKVEGEFSTIIGMPLLELMFDLRSIGIHTLQQPRGPWIVP